MKSRFDPTLRYFAVRFFVLALIYGATAHFTNAVLPEDDGFITYRYVENLVAGKGLVYNPGERVFGASNPLYLFWLALLKEVARDVPVPVLAARLNSVFWVAASVGAFLLFRHLVRSTAISALLAGLLLMRDHLLFESLGGMESFLFLALTVWSIWALASRRWALSATLAGLSVLARPEGVLVAGIVLLGWLAGPGGAGAGGRWRALSFIAALLAPGVAWAGFATPYFGSPIPQSIVAKSQPLYALPFGHALWQVIDHIGAWTTSGLIPDGSWIGSLHVQTRLIVTLMVFEAACLGYGLRRRLLGLRHSPVLLVAALFGLLVVFYFVTNPLMFDWYYPALEVLWFALLIPGIIWLGSSLRRRLPAIGILLTALPLVFLAYSALGPPLSRLYAGEGVTELHIERDDVRSRIVTYQAAAEWLNENAPENWVVAGPEIGALGFYYRGRILDACGLVSREAIRFLPVPEDERSHPESGAIARAFVHSLQPDAVVTMSDFAHLSLYRDPWYQANYVRVGQFALPYELWDSTTVDVFFRRDAIQVKD